jgi:eukaryotic-like serine/threonine-protein kinase
MSLANGTRIGAYEIVGAIGAGGMGEVYRARDTKLGREVAIKILPEQFAADRERVARFEREARTLASLNHPHIAQIYGLEQSGASVALVMELVDGVDLSQRIADGAMPIDEAIPIARQIVEALDAAHGQGIVHRDLKPANIQLRHDGTVKVLDFGLAKPIEGPGGASGATITSPAMSMPGVILGTAAYMAPEQAKGRPVDKRADIWAFGCVLYEMVTGRRAFSGEDVSETIASILRSEPDWNVVPVSIKPLLVSCLQKDPRQRLRDIGDVTLLFDRAPGQVSPVAPASTPIAIKALAALSIVALLASGVLLWRSRVPASGGHAPVVRSTLRFQPDSRLQLGTSQPSLAISPDGNTVVYTAVGPEGNQLWTYRLDSFGPTPLSGTGGGGGPRNVFFSPDGTQIAFFAQSQIKRMPVSGGTVSVVCDATFQYGGTWTERNEIVFAAGGFGSSGTDPALWRVPVSGGEKRLIKEGIYSYPDALPGGRLVLAVAEGAAAARTSSELPIVTVDIDSGDVRPLVEGGTYPRYLASGHVVFLRNGALVATPIDLQARTASDRSSVVVPDVFQNPALVSGNFAVSAAGTLVYAPGTAADFNRSLLLIDSNGQRTVVSDDKRYFEWPRASPDGQKIAVAVPGWRESVWVFDRARGVMTQLTTGDMDGVWPVWTPDGTRIVFTAYNGGGVRNLYWMRADGTGVPERLTTSEFQQRPNSSTPDGKTLVFDVRTATSTDLWTVTLDDKKTARSLIATRFAESSAALSPNGQWMAFTSDQSGRPEIYLTGFPSTDGRIQVSTGGARNAVWSRDGRRLYYRSLDGSEILMVDVTFGSSPSLSRASVVATLPRVAATYGNFDVMPDGRLLVVDDESAGGVAEELRIVVNWLDELKRKMAGGAQSSQ